MRLCSWSFAIVLQDYIGFHKLLEIILQLVITSTMSSKHSLGLICFNTSPLQKPLLAHPHEGHATGSTYILCSSSVLTSGHCNDHHDCLSPPGILHCPSSHRHASRLVQRGVLVGGGSIYMIYIYISIIYTNEIYMIYIYMIYV